MKIPSLLWDQRDVDLCMRLSCFEAFGVFHVRPFLHFLELRRPGIFFEAYSTIRPHLALNKIFILATEDPEHEWSINDVRSFSLRFARALDFAVGHACELEERGYESAGEQACIDIIVDIGTSYGVYCQEQFDEWESSDEQARVTNPMLRFGGIGSVSGGPGHARWLRDQGKPRLR
eukprot:7080707-Prymnesium_polylepis.1